MEFKDYFEGRNIETAYSFPKELINSNNTYQDKYPPAELEKSSLITFLREFFSLK